MQNIGENYDISNNKGFPCGLLVKNLTAISLEMQIWYLGHEDPLETEMATHSNILAWEIPWTGACWL